MGLERYRLFERKPVDFCPTYTGIFDSLDKNFDFNKQSSYLIIFIIQQFIIHRLYLIFIIYRKQNHHQIKNKLILLLLISLFISFVLIIIQEYLA